MLAAGLAAFLKISGGKGLHIVTPLPPRAGWPRVKASRKAVAADAPHLYVATVANVRRRGKT